jgi:hypothetical protein
MNFIASPPGAFGLLASCMLSIFIAGNLINKNGLPSAGITWWIVLCLSGILLLFLIGILPDLPSSVSILVYLIILSSICTASGFVYTSLGFTAFK